MNKKITLTVLIVLMLLPIIMTVCFFPFLPDEVITHIWITTPDSYGSKWGMFLAPGLLFTACNAIFFVLYTFNKNKEEKGLIEESKVSLFSTIGFMVLFDIAALIILVINVVL